jgi:Ankyrin repeats (3 copies)
VPVQMSTLHDAALAGEVAAVARRIAEGAGVNDVRDVSFACSCSTALHIAADYGHRECVQQLLTLGADTALPNLWGHTAAHLAAASGHASVLQVLPPADLNCAVRGMLDIPPLYMCC